MSDLKFYDYTKKSYFISLHYSYGDTSGYLSGVVEMNLKEQSLEKFARKLVINKEGKISQSDPTIRIDQFNDIKI